jgi:hypothetical protein
MKASAIIAALGLYLDLGPPEYKAEVLITFLGCKHFDYLVGVCFNDIHVTLAPLSSFLYVEHRLYCDIDCKLFTVQLQVNNPSYQHSVLSTLKQHG